ncbi:MAG TPA: VCBS repeat-containing protein, partial [Blastocatellia bacterium]|nr:VCBS repeat-containing protein [Blastocatellia bacterium]
MRRWPFPTLALLLAVGAACVRGAPFPEPKLLFADLTQSAGVAHVHQKPIFDERLAKVMPWISSINAGVAVADFNGDGLADIYALGSRPGAANALYRNNGNLTFTNVAEECGVAFVNDKQSVSMDAVFGDIDNDGDQDLFLAGYGRNRLLRNDHGRFVDVTERAGFSGRCNASSAVFLDYNNDGWVDILEGNYFPKSVDLWNIPSTKILPENFVKARNGGGLLLYRNNKNGTFSDVTSSAGLT